MWAKKRGGSHARLSQVAGSEITVEDVHYCWTFHSILWTTTQCELWRTHMPSYHRFRTPFIHSYVTIRGVREDFLMWKFIHSVHVDRTLKCGADQSGVIIIDMSYRLVIHIELLKTIITYSDHSLHLYISFPLSPFYVEGATKFVLLLLLCFNNEDCFSWNFAVRKRGYECLPIIA